MGSLPFLCSPQLSQVLPFPPHPHSAELLRCTVLGLGLSLPHNSPVGLMVLTTYRRGN